MDSITAGAVIIGIVNGIRLIPQKYLVIDSFLSFVIALVLGLVFGVTHLFGLDIQTGLIVALASSGLYKVATKVGGN